MERGVSGTEKTNQLCANKRNIAEMMVGSHDDDDDEDDDDYDSSWLPSSPSPVSQKRARQFDQYSKWRKPKRIRTISLIQKMENDARKTVEFRQRLAEDRTEKAIRLASQRLGENGYSLGTRPNGKGASWVRGTLTNSTEVLKRPRQVAKQLRLSNSTTKAGPDDHQTNRVKSTFTVVTYPIPANDDAIRSIELIAGVLSRAGQDGLKKRIQLLSSQFPGSSDLSTL
ncbi:hypothetical protein H4Q26_008086 [Puccinia striiformis f. sp. tritici PST-130]|nr:hypothetical protein H4Q26_008086 [Puccinia striiformis f. sp. tritici PST-130]